MTIEPTLSRELAPVVAAPGAADAFDRACAVLDQLEQVTRPSREQAALMADHALVWAGLGLSDRARTLLRRWRKHNRTSQALRRAEIVHHVSVSPSTAAAHLRELGASDGQFAALNVVNSLYRGELAVAIELSRAHNWFLDDEELAHGLFHGLWALGLNNEFDEAHEVLDAWKRRHVRAPPMARQFVLRTEAGMASFQKRYLVEEALVEEALALCIEHDLGVARAYTEPSVVAARARADNLAGARALLRTWPRRRRDARGPIEAFRDVAALELAVLADQPRRALAAAGRALRFFERSGHVVMTSFVRLRRTLVACAGDFANELAELERVVRRCPMLHYAQRLRLLQQLVRDGHDCARDVQLAERSRHTCASHGLMRAWTPPISSVAAELFWNRITGTLHVRGEGPFSLGRKPVLRRCLEHLLTQGDFRATIPDMFEAVWSAPYNPITHEGKVHVSVHRLRRWLDSCHAGAGAMIVVADGEIAVADDVDARVLEPTSSAVHAGEPRSVRERVLRLIEAETAPIAPAELQRRLGVSRPALNVALRALVAADQAQRLGRGRATKYVRAQP